MGFVSDNRYITRYAPINEKNEYKKRDYPVLIAGTIVNATDFSIYYILFHFLSFSVSKGISFTCAGIVGYLLGKFWIFKHNRTSYAEIGRYALASV